MPRKEHFNKAWEYSARKTAKNKKRGGGGMFTKGEAKDDPQLPPQLKVCEGLLYTIFVLVYVSEFVFFFVHFVVVAVLVLFVFVNIFMYIFVFVYILVLINIHEGRRNTDCDRFSFTSSECKCSAKFCCIFCGSH